VCRGCYNKDKQSSPVLTEKERKSNLSPSNLSSIKSPEKLLKENINESNIIKISEISKDNLVTGKQILAPVVQAKIEVKATL
jgi:hypothetical protein